MHLFCKSNFKVMVSTWIVELNSDCLFQKLVYLFCQINAKMQSELFRSIYMSIVEVSLCCKGRTAKPTLNGAEVHFQ